MALADTLGTRTKGRRLVGELMQMLSEQIRGGTLKPGEKLPTESAIMLKHGVSRTVVREAISGLQSAGLVTTKHGIGTFVVDGLPPVRFQLEPNNIPAVLDVVAMLEFRMILESEGAALAAARRTEDQLLGLRRALDDFQAAQRNGGNTAETDFQFHLRIAEATGNPYFPEVIAHFGMSTIPRTRVTLFKSAILCADPKLAAKFMRIHLSNSRDRFRNAHEEAVRQA